MWRGLKSWRPRFNEITTSSERASLTVVASEEASRPDASKVFEAFRVTPLDKVKVVICGTDPYPTNSTGIAFDVPKRLPISSSLANISREVCNEYSADFRRVDVRTWCRQGVLMLNASLTVNTFGTSTPWQDFIKKVMTYISDHKKHTVFLLWGSHAKSLQRVIDDRRHLVLIASHPSPRSANRAGSTWWNHKHFIKCDKYLSKHGQSRIQWLEVGIKK